MYSIIDVPARIAHSHFPNLQVVEVQTDKSGIHTHTQRTHNAHIYMYYTHLHVHVHVHTVFRVSYISQIEKSLHITQISRHGILSSSMFAKLLLKI